MSGIVSYHAGLAAEDAVRRHYAAAGWLPLAQRWRGSGGEIDLIFCRGAIYAIVEVKKSKTWSAALARITTAQLRRIEATMLEFLQMTPQGLNADVTCDVAVVDAMGRVQVHVGALGGDALASLDAAAPLAA